MPTVNERLGLGVLALGLIERYEAIQGRGDMGMIWAKGFFIDRQGAFVKRRKAIMKTAGKLSLAFLIMGFAGCAYHQVAEPLPLVPALLAGVRGGGNITFVNAQPSTEDVEVGLAGLGRSLHGNLHQWTEAAINLIQAALTTPPDSAGSSPARVVALSITRAELSSAGGGWGFKCKVHLDVSIDNNQALAFEGERGSWRFPRVCDAAITEAVSNMLKNDTVRNYLTQ